MMNCQKYMRYCIKTLKIDFQNRILKKKIDGLLIEIEPLKEEKHTFEIENDSLKSDQISWKEENLNLQKGNEILKSKIDILSNEITSLKDINFSFENENKIKNLRNKFLLLE